MMQIDKIKPSHYKNAKGTDLFGAMEEQFTPDEFRGFLKGNIWKYTQRYTQKNGVEDLEKAQEYLKTLIEFESCFESGLESWLEMTNEEFKKLADKFNEEDDIKTVGELIKQLEILPKETKIFYDYACLSATVYEEVQTLFIGS